jgi:hypothetical protein
MGESPMSIDRRMLVSVFVVLSLVAVACGSTVSETQQQVAEEQGATGLGGDLGGGELPAGASINKKGQVVSEGGKVLGSAEEFGLDSGGGAGGGTVSGGTGGAGGGPAAAGGGSGGGGSGAAASGAMGPGISANTIKIGIAYADDAEEANRALGAAGATQTSFRRAYEAMIKYVNEHGGAANRKLEPVFHKLSVTSTEPYEQQDQEVCAHWTRDDPVFVADGGFKTDNGLACLQKNGVAMIANNGLRFKSRASFQRYPAYMEHDGIDNDAIARMYADHMKKMRFFNKGYKLGIITWDDPDYAGPTRGTLVSRLKRHGIKVSDITYIRTPESSGDNGETVAQIGNTAVRYKGEGITHVMIMEGGGAIALFFMRSAERQQYRPRYGLHSGSGGTAVAALLAPGGEQEARNQLEDSVMVGWTPTIDVRPEDMPSWASPSSQKLCYKQMRKGGVKMDSQNAKAQALGICDHVWSIQASLDATHAAYNGVLNQETWYRAIGRIGSLQLTHGMGFQVSPSNRDGLELATEAKFINSCTCFKYVGKRFQVPE